MENNQNGVWISREEYERLRQAGQSQTPAPTEYAQYSQPAAVAPLNAPVTKNVQTARALQKYSGIVAAVSVLLLLTGISETMAITPLLYSILGIAIPVLLISSVAGAIAAPRTKQPGQSLFAKLLTPRGVLGGILLVVLLIIAAPVLYGIFMVAMLILMVSFGGGDVGS